MSDDLMMARIDRLSDELGEMAGIAEESERLLIEAQNALMRVAAVIAPHMEAYGWACACCSAVDAAQRGQS